MHLRGGKVARGGLRFSDRPEDFRTEIHGLMATQMVKNVLIVPMGAKGGFVLRNPPADRDALRKAGRQRTWRDTTLYTSLSPCMMCSGTIVQFGIPRVVIAENTTFGGNEDFLRAHGVEVVIADDPDCIALMEKFIREKPELWAEDIAED